MAKLREVSNIQEKKSNKLKIDINDLLKIKPVTINQSKFFGTFDKSDFFVLSGYPGTGKSFIALYNSLNAVLNRKFKKIVIIRSATPARDLGALPGDLDEKMAAYELPYVQICERLFGRSDAYTKLKEQKYISFVSTSYLRSVTFDDSIIILDEFQNCSDEEIFTVATRIGDNSKLILCGDRYQIDLKKTNDKSGFDKFMTIARNIPSLVHIMFDNVEDICRSGFVKDFILAKIKVENV